MPSGQQVQVFGGSSAYSFGQALNDLVTPTGQTFGAFPTVWPMPAGAGGWFGTATMDGQYAFALMTCTGNETEPTMYSTGIGVFNPMTSELQVIPVPTTTGVFNPPGVNIVGVAMDDSATITRTSGGWPGVVIGATASDIGGYIQPGSTVVSITGNSLVLSQPTIGGSQSEVVTFTGSTGSAIDDVSALTIDGDNHVFAVGAFNYQNWHIAQYGLPYWLMAFKETNGVYAFDHTHSYTAETLAASNSAAFPSTTNPFGETYNQNLGPSCLVKGPVSGHLIAGNYYYASGVYSGSLVAVDPAAGVVTAFTQLPNVTDTLGPTDLKISVRDMTGNPTSGAGDERMVATFDVYNRSTGAEYFLHPIQEFTYDSTAGTITALSPPMSPYTMPNIGYSLNYGVIGYDGDGNLWCPTAGGTGLGVFTAHEMHCFLADGANVPTFEGAGESYVIPSYTKADFRFGSFDGIQAGSMNYDAVHGSMDMVGGAVVIGAALAESPAFGTELSVNGSVSTFTVTSTLTNGTASGTTLNISSLTGEIANGATVAVTDGTHTQLFVLTAQANSGASSISIVSENVTLNTGSGYLGTWGWQGFFTSSYLPVADTDFTSGYCLELTSIAGANNEANNVTMPVTPLQNYVVTCQIKGTTVAEPVHVTLAWTDANNNLIAGSVSCPTVTMTSTAIISLELLTAAPANAVNGFVVIAATARSVGEKYRVGSLSWKTAPALSTVGVNYNRARVTGGVGPNKGDVVNGRLLFTSLNTTSGFPNNVGESVPQWLTSVDLNAVVNDPSTTAPYVPTLSTITGGSMSVTLTWTAPTNNGGTPLISYTLLRSTSTTTEVPIVTGIAPNATSYTDTTAVSGTEYFYTLQAVNGVGASEQSNELHITPAGVVPGAATLGVAAGNTQNVLTWSAPTTGQPFTAVEVYSGASAGSLTLHTTLGNVTTYTHTGLTNGTEVFYAVYYVNASGTGPESNVANGTPEATSTMVLPPAVTSLAAVVSGSTATATWVNNGSATTNVLAIGDSITALLPTDLTADLNAAGVTTVYVDGQGGTGLDVSVDPTSYDWDTETPALISAHDPQVLIVGFGTNDRPETTGPYTTIVNNFLSTIPSSLYILWWLPYNDVDGGLTTTRAVITAAAATHSNLHVIDPDPIFAANIAEFGYGNTGSYVDSGGIHPTAAGQTVLSAFITAAVPSGNNPTLGNDFYVDGTQVGSYGYPSAPETSYEFTGLSVGSHTLGVAPYNSAGVGPITTHAVTISTAPSTATLKGLYTGNISTAESLATALGISPLQVYSDYPDGTSYTTIGNYSPPTLPSGCILSLGLNMCANGTNLASVAANIGTYTTLAKRLPNNAIMRLGYEFDINTGPWGPNPSNGNGPNTPAQYIAAWKLIYNAMMAVNSSFKWDFCCNSGTSTAAQLANWYPGDAYVDYIGGDHYNTDGGTGSDTFSAMEACATFAVQRGKPVSCGEWGLNHGDSPTFINDASQFFNTPSVAASRYGISVYTVAYHSYFSDSAYGSDIDSGNYPNSFAAFKADFGNATPPTTGTAGFNQPVMAAPAGPHLKGTYTKTVGTGPGQMFWDDTFQTGELNPAYWRNTWGDVVAWGNDPGYGVGTGTATVAPASAGGGLTCSGGVPGPSANVVTCEPINYSGGPTPLVNFPEGGWYIQIRFKLSAVDTFFPAFWFPRGGTINSGVTQGCELDWFEGGNIPGNTLNNSQSHSDYNGDQQSAFGPFLSTDWQWPFNFGGATSGTDDVDFAIMGMEYRPAERILNYYAQSSPSMNYPDVLILGASNETFDHSGVSTTSTFSDIFVPSQGLGAPNYVFGVTPQGNGKMFIAEVQAYALPS